MRQPKSSRSQIQADHRYSDTSVQISELSISSSKYREVGHYGKPSGRDEDSLSGDISPSDTMESSDNVRFDEYHNSGSGVEDDQSFQEGRFDAEKPDEAYSLRKQYDMAMPDLPRGRNGTSASGSSVGGATPVPFLVVEEASTVWAKRRDSEKKISAAVGKLEKKKKGNLFRGLMNKNSLFSEKKSGGKTSSTESKFVEAMDIVAFPERHIKLPPMKVNCTSPDYIDFEKTMDVIAFPEKQVNFSPKNFTCASSGHNSFEKTMDMVAFNKKGINCSPVNLSPDEGIAGNDTRATPCERVSSNEDSNTSNRPTDRGNFDKTVDLTALALHESNTGSTRIMDNCAVPPDYSTFEKTMDIIAFPEQHIDFSSLFSSAKWSENDRKLEEKCFRTDGVVAPTGCADVDGCSVPAGQVSRQETQGFRPDMLDYLCVGTERFLCSPESRQDAAASKTRRDDDNSVYDATSNRNGADRETVDVSTFSIDPSTLESGSYFGYAATASQKLRNSCACTEAVTGLGGATGSQKLYDSLVCNEAITGLDGVTGSQKLYDRCACTEAITGLDRTDLDDYEVPDLPRDQSLVSECDSVPSDNSSTTTPLTPIPTPPRRQQPKKRGFSLRIGRRGASKRDSKSTKRSNKKWKEIWSDLDSFARERESGSSL